MNGYSVLDVYEDVNDTDLILSSRIFIRVHSKLNDTVIFGAGHITENGMCTILNQ